MVKSAKMTKLAGFSLKNVEAGLRVTQVTASCITIHFFASFVLMLEGTKSSKLAMRELVQLTNLISSHCGFSEITVQNIDWTD